MKHYECLVIFPPDTSPETHKPRFEALEGAVKKFGGTIKNKSEWGRRPAAYPLKKHRDGFFVIYDFDMDPLSVIEFSRALTLDADVLKYMITAKKSESARDKKKKSRGKVAPAKVDTVTAS